MFLVIISEKQEKNVALQNYIYVNNLKKLPLNLCGALAHFITYKYHTYKEINSFTSFKKKIMTISCNKITVSLHTIYHSKKR